MGGVTFDSYYPHMALPVYLRLEPANHYERKVGETVNVEVEDEDRSDEPGPYNRVHECEIVSVQELKWRDVSPILLAYLSFSKSKKEAVKRICPGGEPLDDDREVQLLTLLRIDKTKEFISGDTDVIPGDFTKSYVEK